MDKYIVLSVVWAAFSKKMVLMYGVQLKRDIYESDAEHYCVL